MEEFFRECPAAVRNAGELAARCWSGIKLGLVALPDYVGEDGKPLGPAEQVAELRRLARAGLAARVGQVCVEYEKRLGYELDVIAGTGFAGYFLIYADFMRWGKAKNIRFGPGRGSGAGSVVVWALGITDLDPIKYGLLFERFMNPERCGKVGPDGRPQAGSGGGLPDIDTDICKRRRWEVIEYLREKYGRESVGRIVTYKVLVGKTALKDAGRAFGLGFHRLNALLAGAPLNVKNKKGELKAPTVDWLAENCAALRDAAATDPLVAEVVAAARELEECVRDAGVHPSGIVIGRGPLADWVPCARTKDGELCSQWDMREAEDAGLVKLDLLGLSTVTMLDLAEKMSGVELASLSLDDQATYGLMARGDTLGIFQMGKGGFRRMLREMRPDRFGDVVAAGALYRPGPLQGGMTRSYCARKHGREPIAQIHPLLEEITRGTYGCFVYQESIMASARVLAGYSLGEADLLRRAMGKKKPEEMRRERVKFIGGCVRLGTCDEKRAGEIFDLIDHFSSYGFNVSHNTTYSLLSYYTT
jgi:DNA polymerase-3 subunit alpha